MPAINRYRYLEPEVSPSENPQKFAENAVGFIKKTAKIKPETHKVELPLSGGVDSSTVAALFNLALGSDFHLTHIDTGFMRIINGEEEPKLVAQRFSGFENFELTNARPLFYNAVFGLKDAEEKRLAFRDDAYRIVVDQQVVRHRADTLTDGTILPDIKETPAVKTQHNVNVPYEGVKKEIQPLAGLYKNEVRALARYLYETYGFEFLEDAQDRQPFPGPGLSVRVVGPINQEKLNTEKKANDIVEQTIDNYSCALFGTRMFIDPKTGEQIPFQSFAATLDNSTTYTSPTLEGRINNMLGKKVETRLLKVRATGIKNGKRVYSHPVCIETENIEYDDLLRVGREIPAETGYSRVLYKIAEGWEKAPYIVAVRSVRSVDAVTAHVLKVPLEILKNIGKHIAKDVNVAGVYFDLTPKLSTASYTSATIEFE